MSEGEKHARNHLRLVRPTALIFYKSQQEMYKIILCVLPLSKQHNYPNL